jgi:hypothetical protein
MHENVVDYGQKSSSEYKFRKKADLWHNQYYLVDSFRKYNDKIHNSKIMNHKITYNYFLSPSQPVIERFLYLYVNLSTSLLKKTGRFTTPRFPHVKTLRQSVFHVHKHGFH